MSQDPFATVTPVGSREPTPLAALSQGEKQDRRRRGHAQRAGRRDVTPAEKNLGDGSSSAPLPTNLTVADLTRMCSEIVVVNHRAAVDAEAKGADRKNSSVAVGVMVDKLSMLRAHRDQGANASDDELRPGVRELARLIAGEVDATPEPAA